MVGANCQSLRTAGSGLICLFGLYLLLTKVSQNGFTARDSCRTLAPRTFVRSWTGFCVYKIRLEMRGEGYIIVEVWVSRDSRQYGGSDAGEDVERLSFLIDGLLLGEGQITRS
jgi:hypothetical protein